jgi:3-dehydroquinate dehydratase-1
MICVSIAEPTPEACLRAMKGLRFAEIRIDKIEGVKGDDIRRIFSRRVRLIATCRPGKIGDRKKLALLSAAVRAGAAFVDIEHDWNPSLKAVLIKTARAASCRVLMSFHDFERTPAAPALERIIRNGRAEGADVVKIACRVRSSSDNTRLLGLLDGGRPLVVVGIGAEGKITRVVAPLVGGLFTYAALRPGKEVADGQIDRATLQEIWRRLKNV